MPRGAGTTVSQRYLELPASERVNFLEHVVTRGETLSGIAERYRVSVSLLLAANPGVKARALRIGARLKVPVSAVARGVARRPANRATQQASSGVASVAPAAPPAGTVHVVEPGETLWFLSRRYGATVAALRQWNGMSAGEVLRAGQRLIVAAPASDDGSRED